MIGQKLNISPRKRTVNQIIMDSMQEEKQRLMENLQKVQEKFLNDWSQSFIQMSTDKEDKFKTSMMSGKENLNELEEKILQYRAGSEKKLEVVKQQKEEVQKLEVELRELQITAQNVLEKRNQEQKHHQDIEEQLEKERKDVLTTEEAVTHKIKQFTKGIEYFKERLGLAFKKVNDDNLQFVFKYIDPNDWERAFSFKVAVSESREYTVIDCHPAVEGMDKMLQELNKTNNFSKFVISIRRKFKELVTKI